MRAVVVSLVALTFCFPGAYPDIVEHPELRKEFGKGLSVIGGDRKENVDGRMSTEEVEREEDDEERDEGDEPKVEGRVKETSVHKKHFMDQYYLQSGPVKYEYGHVCEDPDDWEHRYEKRDFENNRHQGQVKWGDANGGQGEQLWDFNHGGKDSNEDEEDSLEEKRKEHRFQKPPRKKIQIKEKIIEKTSDDNGSSEFRRSKSGTTTYSGDKKEEGKYEEVVTRNNKKKQENPFFFDPLLFDSMETPRGFSKLDFDFGDTGLHHGFDHHDFDIDRMGELAPVAKVDIPTLPIAAVFPSVKGGSKINLEGSSLSKNVEKTEGNGKTNDEIRRIDTVVAKNKSDDSKKNVEGLQDIRRYFPTALLKRSVAYGRLPKIPSGKDQVPSGTKESQLKELRIDPVSGSLTDKKTGRKFKIFGILVDS